MLQYGFQIQALAPQGFIHYLVDSAFGEAAHRERLLAWTGARNTSSSIASRQLGEEHVCSFTAVGKKRQPLPDVREQALLFWMAEKRRERRLRFLASGERVLLFAKVYYPILIVPYSGVKLMLDPLKVNYYRLVYPRARGLDELADQLKAAAEMVQLVRTLNLHRDLFETMTESSDTSLPGIIHGSVASSVVRYASQTARPERVPDYQLLLDRESCRHELELIIQQLEKTRGALGAELQALEGLGHLLESRSSEAQLRLAEAIEGTRREYDEQLEATKTIVAKSVQELAARRDSELNAAVSRYSELRDFFAEQVGETRKLILSVEKEEGMLARMVAETTPQLASQTAPWRLMLKEMPARKKSLQRDLQRMERVISEIDVQKTGELARVRKAYSDLIRAKEKTLGDLEIEKDVEVRKRRDQSEELGVLVSSLSQSISDRISLVRQKLGFLEDIKVEWLAGGGPILLAVPIYMVRYEKPSGVSRYESYAPSFFEPLTISSPLKWKSTALRQLFRPISAELREFFSRELIEALQRDPVLERKIRVSLIRNNLLKNPEARTEVAGELDDLERRGWLFRGEVHDLKDLLLREA